MSFDLVFTWDRSIGEQLRIRNTNVHFSANSDRELDQNIYNINIQNIIIF